MGDETLLKYHRYVLKDILSKTRIEVGGGYRNETLIHFPYFPGDTYYSWILDKLEISDMYIPDFSGYVRVNYGVDESEVLELYEDYLLGLRQKVRQHEEQ